MARTINIETRTKNLLKKYDAFKTPVDIFLLIEKMGICCEHQALESSLSGVLKMGDANNRMVVNSNHSKVQQRFAAAHLLGHFVLHSEESTEFWDHGFGKGVKDSGISERFKSRASHTREIELEANRFAATTLMPRDLIKSRIYDFDIDPTLERHVLRLCRLFDVGELAMSLRLSALGMSYFKNPR